MLLLYTHHCCHVVVRKTRPLKKWRTGGGFRFLRTRIHPACRLVFPEMTSNSGCLPASWSHLQHNSSIPLPRSATGAPWASLMNGIRCLGFLPLNRDWKPSGLCSTQAGQLGFWGPRQPEPIFCFITSGMLLPHLKRKAEEFSRDRI